MVVMANKNKPCAHFGGDHFGAYTRISDAGLGCPDWPGCYGQMVVPSHSEDIIRATQHFPEHTIEPNKAWLEMIHRYVAGTLGLFIVALAFVSMKVSHVSKRLPLALVLVVFFKRHWECGP